LLSTLIGVYLVDVLEFDEPNVDPNYRRNMDEKRDRYEKWLGK